LGHKVHPTGFRLGVIKDWQSKWYSEAHYAEYIQEDNKLREEIKRKYPEAAISLIEIDRQAKDVTITLHTARPGIVIGRGGQRVDEMRQYLEALISKKIRLNIQEIRQPELDAYLVARSVAEQIERRIAYRRAMKQAIFRTIQAGAKGIKVSAAGRLANAEIARRQTSHEGQVPLHTLRADIDYGFTEAHTTLGRIGVKVWIYKGQVLPEVKTAEAEEKPAEAAAEAAPAAITEEKPVEVAAKVAPAAVPEEKPVEVAAKAAPAAAPKEKAARVTAKVAPAAVPEEKPAEIAAKAAPAAPKEKAARVTAKAAPAAAPEEKPAEAAAKAAPALAPEEKPARPRAKRVAKTTEAEVTEVKVTEAKATEAKVAKDKTARTKATEARAAEPKAKVVEPEAAEEKPAAPKKRRKTTAAKAEETAPDKTQKQEEV
jgi:small subunit ribosomal protein S3